MQNIPMLCIIVRNDMKDTIINDLYDRLSKILKNDQKYSYATIGELISGCIENVEHINSYYDQYPPLVDILELGAAIEYASIEYRQESLQQIRYKMLELKKLLPDIS